MLKVGMKWHENFKGYTFNSSEPSASYEFLQPLALYNLKLISFNSVLLLILLLTLILTFFKLTTSIKPHNSFITLNIVQYTDLSHSLKPLFIGGLLLVVCAKSTTLFLPGLILVMLLQPVLSSPILYLYVFNTNSLLCISMCQKKSILTTLTNDFIALFSFSLRFVSQYIRIILITTVFVLLFEFTDVSFIVNTYQSYSTYQWSITTSLLSIFRLLLELVDCFFILSVQLSTFFTVLLWLLSFLFLIKFNNVFEN